MSAGAVSSSRTTDKYHRCGNPAFIAPLPLQPSPQQIASPTSSSRKTRTPPRCFDEQSQLPKHATATVTPAKLRRLTALWLLDATTCPSPSPKAPSHPLSQQQKQSECPKTSAIYRSLYFAERSCPMIGVGVVEKMPWLLLNNEGNEGRKMLERLRRRMEKKKNDDTSSSGGFWWDRFFGGVTSALVLLNPLK